MARAKDIEKRGKVRNLLQEHLPWKTIHSLTGASDTLILSVRDEMVRDGFDEDRELSIKLGRISAIALAKVEEQLQSGEVKPKDAIVIGAVSLDKRLLLSGRATSRVEHVRSDTAALREQLANVIDVPTNSLTNVAPESPVLLNEPAKTA